MKLRVGRFSGQMVYRRPLRGKWGMNTVRKQTLAFVRFRNERLNSSFKAMFCKTIYVTTKYVRFYK